MLPFDFYIESRSILIEFDGAQHYIPVGIFGGEDGFIDRQRKDNIKTVWADKNNYRLIRIRFDEDLNQALLDLQNYL